MENVTYQPLPDGITWAQLSAGVNAGTIIHCPGCVGENAPHKSDSVGGIVSHPYRHCPVCHCSRRVLVVPVKSDFGLQSKGHAEQVRNILNKAWFAAYCADKQSEETRMMRSALERVREAALVKFATPNPAHPECATCLEQSVFGGPSHEASPRCRSGRRPHCTCDTCF